MITDFLSGTLKQNIKICITARYTLKHKLGGIKMGKQLKLTQIQLDAFDKRLDEYVDIIQDRINGIEITRLPVCDICDVMIDSGGHDTDCSQCPLNKYNHKIESARGLSVPCYTKIRGQAMMMNTTKLYRARHNEIEACLDACGYERNEVLNLV